MEEHLIVTCVKPLHGFLQIFGHKKPNLLAQLDSQINAYQPAIKKLASQSELYSNLEFDTIYLAHTAGTNKYHRCIVREKRASNKAIIQLIDYGNDFEVDASLVSIFCILVLTKCLAFQIHGISDSVTFCRSVFLFGRRFHCVYF